MEYYNDQIIPPKFSADSVMNKSMSKSMYSFPKGARFDEIKKTSPSKFYNPKVGCFHRNQTKGKGAGMGFGKRFTEGFVNTG